ncbi:unnamed protein product [Calypogeia fissa]
MARKLMTATQLQDMELAYEGYDPAWIIGTHHDPLPLGAYGPYAAAATYGPYRSRSTENSNHMGIFNYYDPHRRMPLPGFYGRAATPPVVVIPGPGPVPGPGPGPILKASKVALIPSVTTVIYPHGHGHTLGSGHGHKNIVIVKIPYCCEGCEGKWKDALMEIPGFKGVNVDRRHEGMVLRATVFGDMDTHSVVKTIQKYQPRAELWGGGLLR